MCLPPGDSELVQFLRGIEIHISVFTPSRPYVENDNNSDNQIPDVMATNPSKGARYGPVRTPAAHQTISAQDVREPVVRR